MGDIDDLMNLVAQQIRAAGAAQIRHDNLIEEMVRARNAPVGPAPDLIAAAAAAERQRV